MIKRNIVDRIYEALKYSRVLLMNGARQSGKTTLVRMLAESMNSVEYVTLDDINTLSSAQRDPTGFIAQYNKPVIIDEVQRAPEIFLPIKVAVDKAPKPGSFILTGSANVFTLPKLADSLAGRMEIISLWPLSQGEIEGKHETFIDRVFEKDYSIPRCNAIDKDDLLDRMLRGGYPEILSRDSERSRKNWFDAYITTLLERDVRDISAIRDLKDFPLLLQALALRSSTLFNISDISRTIGIQNDTLKRYITLLESMFIVVEHSAWSARMSKRFHKTPKLMLNDTGLLSNILGIDKNRLMIDPFLYGQMLETFVAMELRKQATWSDTTVKLYHFRDHKGAEVDIVLETPAGDVVGIEVKATASPGLEDISGLKTFQAIAGKKFKRGIVLHTGSTRTHHSDNIYFVPISCLWR